jgi:hypothetical protein
MKKGIRCEVKGARYVLYPFIIIFLRALVAKYLGKGSLNDKG